MPLESTMICLDNSEFMRNGDYLPTRFTAQQDAAGVLCHHRIRDNPESTVGILTMAGQGVDLLVSPTEEIGKILACFARMKMGGNIDLTTSIQIAQLALKHRKNKNGGQRIIVFVGGHISETVEALQKLGKQLKKNNVALDVISIGEAEENVPKLQELINATNTNDNSHLVVVPAGSSPTTTLQTSAVMYNEGGMANVGGGMGGGDDFDIYGGIDPSMDPELAMAIRISQEEAKAAEEARVRNLAAETAASSSSSAGAVGALAGFDEEEDEETLIQRALEMSMRDMEAPKTADSQPSAGNAPMEGIEEDDEELELQRALALSMGASSGNDSVDPDLVNQLLNSSDVSDPLIQAALEQLGQHNTTDDNKDKDDKNKKRKSDDL